MKIKLLIYLVIQLLVFSNLATAQEYIITGKVTNASLEPLPYVSVRVKEMQTGTITDKDGKFKLQLEAGKYDLAFSIVGYQPQVITIAFAKNQELNIILVQSDTKALNEVLVQSIKKDRAEEYVRNVIRNKEDFLNAAKNYRCNVYIKATDENDLIKKRKVKDTVQRPGALFAGMNMAEIYLIVDHAYPNKVKEERTAVKIRGNRDGLFYLTTTDGDFNFYNNLVQLPSLSDLPMLSPVSYSGLVAYRYKTIGHRVKEGRNIYKIKVTPTKFGNALVSGEMEIMDSAWVILNTNFEMPKYHLPEYDYFSVQQKYEWVAAKAWMPVRQEFNYITKAGKAKQSGRTIAVYDNYSIDTVFKNKYFNNEVSATALEAYKKDTAFWNVIRKEPLTQKEVRFIQFTDSVTRAHTNAVYLDSVEKYNNKITLKKIFIDGIVVHNWRKERTMIFPTIPDFFQPVQFGGPRISTFFFLSKVYKNKKHITLNTTLNYGLRNKDINGEVGFSKLYNPFNRSTYFISVQKDFGEIFEGDAWINQIKRSNVYLKKGVEFSHSIELFNGLVMRNRFEITRRQSVANYKTGNLVDSTLGFLLTNNQARDFPSYNAFYNTIGFDYTPFQKYIREPYQKTILGSNWPTFSITWRKGVKGLFNSAIDFNYLEYGIRQKIKLGLAGEFNYNVISGAFATKKDLRLVDYKFMREGDPYLFQNPTKSFQALDSSFPIFKRFYEAHAMHQFHGALLNRIPFIKKLGLLEVAGGGFLYVPERNLRYAEAFVGVEKILRFWRERYKVGVFAVGSVANKFNNPVQFKLSFTKFDKRKNSWY